jgi:hypothetical protein
MDPFAEQHFLKQFWAASGGAPADLAQVQFTGEGALTSCFEVTAFAAASVAAAALAAATLSQTLQGQARPSAVTVDRRLSSMWFRQSVRPQGWPMPPTWDAVAGDYATADGWIKLHTNAALHRAAALRVLKVTPERDAVAHAVSRWTSEALEAAVVAEGGCAAALRSAAAWQAHPQGQAVAQAPLLAHVEGKACANLAWTPPPDAPLRGVRVLDLTRILAGPVATRMLAALGAEVLRIDPPGWDEPALAPEVTVGKRCARLDLKTEAGLAQLRSLLEQADVLVHGYRSDALDRLGLGAQARQALRPGLVDVSLNAYGFTGPWAQRRGFDSLVQMSIGVAEAGQQTQGAAQPVPLPVQALDHATGYLLACAVLQGLRRRLLRGQGVVTRASLARSGLLLMSLAGGTPHPPLATENEADWAPGIEPTGFGPARRLRLPWAIEGISARFGRPAGPLGSAAAAWQTSR